MEYEVEKILEKKIVRDKEQFLLKWVGVKKPTWEHKSNLTGCHELLLKFERFHGPEIIGAKRDDVGVQFMVVSENKEKVVNLNDANLFAIKCIDFLEPKIIFEAEKDDDEEEEEDTGENVEDRDGTEKVIYASKAKEKIIYFIKKSNGEIVTMPTDEAAVVYPRQVLEYLAHSIDKN